MKKIIFITLMLVSILYPQSKKLTLSESIELGLQNSKDIKISQSKLNSSEAKVSEVKSMFLPQLKFLASYTRLSDNVPPFDVITPSSSIPLRVADAIFDQYSMRLSLHQPLFTGLKLLSTKNSAEYNFNAAESEYSKEMNEAAMSIHTAFWNYYRAQQVKDLLTHSLNQIENHLKDTKNFLDNGLVTQNDYLKLQVQYSNTKLQLIEAENNLDLALAVFNKALGLPLENLTEIVIEEIKVHPLEFELDELYKEAMANRDEIRALEFKLISSQENITTAQSGWFPNVNLIAGINYSNPNIRFQPPVAEFNYNWDINVNLSWDLWNWGLTSSQTAQAEELSVQTQASLEKLNDNIEVEVYQSYLSVIKSNEKVEVSKLSLEQASENYRITSEKYNAQLATSTDLIDAEVSELQAGTNLKTALVDYQLAKTRLEKSLGRVIY